MSLCPTCKKDTDAAVKIAYKLGMDRAEHKLRRQINVIENAYGHLFDEITRLEIDDPKYGVMVSEKMMKQIISLLKKHTQAHILIKTLKNLLETEDFKTLEKLKDYIEIV